MPNFNTIFPSLVTKASSSPINMKLSAVIIKGNRMVSPICTNTERNICRRRLCGSLHAEATAILSYYGKNLSYSQKEGWKLSCLKERHRKSCCCTS